MIRALACSPLLGTGLPAGILLLLRAFLSFIDVWAVISSIPHQALIFYRSFDKFLTNVQ